MPTSKAEGRVAFPTRGRAYLFERLKDFVVAALAQVKVRPCRKIAIFGCLCKSRAEEFLLQKRREECEASCKTGRQLRKIMSELRGSKDEPSSYLMPASFALFKPALC